MAASDYILCDKCGIKLIYDGVRDDDPYTNRQWWQDRFGEELTLICPICRDKEKSDGR